MTILAHWQGKSTQETNLEGGGLSQIKNGPFIDISYTFLCLLCLQYILCQFQT